ncbi:hypothetical protein BOX15_Mlig018367g2 [Macrostomum lignano]|uniref:Kinesin motor domain-containing protein n=1 Tax=Macrostomum lignano TaxID=282301 RepID=A0A267DZC7_9PLAT|nr:hypothetical protein BOX15_Mlig018367g2 [Macrostomum lignano]
MIACVNPSPEQGSETVNTLRYASRAKRIEVCPEVNLDPQEKLLRSLKREVASLRQENGSLREQLRTSAAQSEAGGATAVDRSGGRGDTGRLVRSREASLGGSDDQRSNPAAAGAAAARPVSKGSYQSLYEMLQEYMQENETLRSENLDLAKHQTDYRREQNQLSEENRRLASQLSRMRRQFEQQQQQQQQQQRQTPVYVVSNPETPTRLPLIEARREAERWRPEILPDCRRARRGGRCRRQTIGSLSGSNNSSLLRHLRRRLRFRCRFRMLIGSRGPSLCRRLRLRFCQLLSNTRSNTRSNPHLA